MSESFNVDTPNIDAPAIEPPTTDPVREPFEVHYASRVDRLPPYMFGRINNSLYQKRRAGDDVIDLSGEFIDDRGTLNNLTDLTDNFMTETRKHVIIEIRDLSVKLVKTRIDDLSESDFIF